MTKKVVLLIIFIFFGASTVVALAFWLSDELAMEIVSLNLENNSELETVDFDIWREKEQAQIKELQEKANQTATLFVVGDIMLSRAVERTMLAKNDFSYCLVDVRKIVESADLAIGNLESPIIEGKTVDDNSFIFRAHPESANALKLAGFDVMSLPNNHIGNMGSAGILKTFDYLNSVGIDFVGVGKNSAELVNPLISQVRDLKIAFLSYAYGPNNYSATVSRPGMAIMNNEQLLIDIQEAKDQEADLIILSMHNGVEYEIDPTPSQQNFARLAIDNGVDLVIGHHPHVVQRMEVYKDKYIFYSLGNFVFDQMWSLETRQGLGIMFTLSKSGVVDLQYYPVLIENYCRPRFVEGAEAKVIIDRLGVKE